MGDEIVEIEKTLRLRSRCAIQIAWSRRTGAPHNASEPPRDQRAEARKGAIENSRKRQIPMHAQGPEYEY